MRKVIEAMIDRFDTEMILVNGKSEGPTMARKKTGEAKGHARPQHPSVAKKEGGIIASGSNPPAKAPATKVPVVADKNPFVSNAVTAPAPKKKGPYHQCWESHEPLKIVVGGKDYFVNGGSCRYEPGAEFDIFIGFDAGMTHTLRALPWNEGTEVYFHIQDMTAPKDLEQFKKLVAWSAEQILAGKKLYAGCIGGHGRTGTFLAALVTYMTGEEDSITYVRKNYCQKAVETSSQVEFLHKHFGIRKIESSKGSGYGNLGWSGFSGSTGVTGSASTAGTRNYPPIAKSAAITSPYQVKPL